MCVLDTLFICLCVVQIVLKIKWSHVFRLVQTFSIRLCCLCSCLRVTSGMLLCFMAFTLVLLVALFWLMSYSYHIAVPRHGMLFSYDEIGEVLILLVCLRLSGQVPWDHLLSKHVFLRPITAWLTIAIPSNLPLLSLHFFPFVLSYPILGHL